MKKILACALTLSLLATLFVGIVPTTASAETAYVDATEYKALFYYPNWTPVYMTNNSARNVANVSTHEIVDYWMRTPAFANGVEDPNYYAAMYVNAGDPNRQIQPGGTTDMGFCFTAPKTALYRVDFKGKNLYTDGSDGMIVYVADSNMQQIASTEVTATSGELSKTVALSAGEQIYVMVNCRWNHSCDLLGLENLSIFEQVEEVVVDENKYVESNSYKALWGAANFKGIYIPHANYTVAGIADLEYGADYYARIPGGDAYMYVNAGDTNRFSSTSVSNDIGFEFTAPTAGIYKVKYTGYYNANSNGADGFIFKVLNKNAELVGQKAYTVYQQTEIYEKYVELEAGEKIYLVFNQNVNNWFDSCWITDLSVIEMAEEINLSQDEYKEGTVYTGFWGKPNFRGVYIPHSNYTVSGIADLVLNEYYQACIPGGDAFTYINEGDPTRFAPTSATNDIGFEFTAPAKAYYKINYTGYYNADASNPNQAGADGFIFKVLNNNAEVIGQKAYTVYQQTETYEKYVLLEEGEKIYLLFNQNANNWHDRCEVVNLSVTEMVAIPQVTDKTVYELNNETCTPIYVPNTNYNVSAVGNLEMRIHNGLVYYWIPEAVATGDNIYGNSYMTASDLHRIIAPAADYDLGVKFVAPETSDYRFDLTALNENIAYGSDGVTLVMMNSNSEIIKRFDILGDQDVTTDEIVHLEAGEALYIVFNKYGHYYSEGTWLKTFTMTSVDVKYPGQEEEAPEEEKVSEVPGDADGDGIVNVLDLVVLRNHLLGKALVKSELFVNADNDYDDEITIIDLLDIKKYIVTGTLPSHSLMKLTPNAESTLGLIYSSGPLNLSTKDSGKIKFNITNTAGEVNAYVQFITDNINYYNNALVRSVTLENGTKTYTVDLADSYGFDGNIIGIKITTDNIASGKIVLNEINFVKGNTSPIAFTLSDKIVAATRDEIKATTSNGISFFPDGHMSVMKNSDGTLTFISSSPKNNVEYGAMAPMTAYKGTLEDPIGTLLYENKGYVNSPNGTGEEEYNYGSIGKVYNYEGTKCFATVHLEQYFDAEGNRTSAFAPACMVSTLALAYSPDMGETWYYAGEIISHECEAIDPYYGIKPHSEFGTATRDIGTGAFIVKDGEVYVYFTDYAEEYKMSLAVAKASLEDVIYAAENVRGGKNEGLFTKFYNGSFSEPGLAGKSSSIVDESCAANHLSIIYNESIDKYILARCSSPLYHTNDGDIIMNISDDPTNFFTRNYTIDASVRGQQYPTLVGTGDNPSFVCGDTVYLYYIDAPFHSTSLWDEANLVYRVINFD